MLIEMPSRARCENPDEIARRDEVYEESEWELCGLCAGTGDDPQGYHCPNCRGLGETRKRVWSE
jgi:DnaJ-class molecular chaperone